jgi:hypothetical protein
MPGKKLHIKCYLEGVEVPLNAVQISIGVDQASTANVTIPPTNTAFKIRPRTRVHLFWLDDATGVWYLLWEGEVLAVGFEKSPTSRRVSLSCADLSNYWDYTLKMLYEGKMGIESGKNVQMFYGDTEMMVHFTPSATLEKLWANLSSGGKNYNLVNAIYSVLMQVTKSLPYYRRVDEKIGLAQQLIVLNDTRIERLLKTITSAYLIQNLLGNDPERISIRDMLKTISGMAGYTICPVGSPSYIKHTLNSFLLKPNLFGCLPPRCNVVFPDTCTNIQYGRQFMEEPTRSFLSAPLAGDASSTVFRMQTSPAYLADKIKTITNGKPSMEQVLTTFTDEELEKGILPISTRVPYPELFASRGGKVLNKEYVQQYGDYMFQMSRYASRSLSFSSELNPWLACGFPCVVFDTARSFAAQIHSISHVIDASGGGYTQVQCGLAQELDASNDDTPYVPSWMSEAYHPTVINDAYQNLLGCDAMGSKSSMVVETSSSVTATPLSQSQSAVKISSANIPATRINISEVAKNLYNSDPNAKSEYHEAVRANAAYSFADNYRRRNIATMNDVLKFYLLQTDEPLPPSQFDGFQFVYSASMVENQSTNAALGTTAPALKYSQVTYISNTGVDPVTSIAQAAAAETATSAAIPQSINPGAVIKSPKYKREIVETYVKEIKKSQVLDGR